MELAPPSLQRPARKIVRSSYLSPAKAGDFIPIAGSISGSTICSPFSLLADITASPLRSGVLRKYSARWNSHSRHPLFNLLQREPGEGNVKSNGSPTGCLFNGFCGGACSD